MLVLVPADINGLFVGLGHSNFLSAMNRGWGRNALL